MRRRERFESKFIPEPTSGCWLWTGALTERGDYGKMQIGGKHERAHRVSWKLFRGPIPEGRHVLHRCDVGICVNPDHLFLGTQADNNRDMFSKGRSYDRRGTANPRAKLSTNDVTAIRRDPRPQHLIATAFGVGQSTVSRVKRRESHDL